MEWLEVDLDVDDPGEDIWEDAVVSGEDMA